MGGRGGSIGAGAGSGRRRATGWDGYIGEKGYKQVGSIEGNPIVEHEETINASQPIYSSEPNAVYFTRRKSDGLIHHISFYNQDRKLTHSVDLLERRGVHAHRWDYSDSPKRDSHKRQYDAKLTNRDKHYIKLALDYNENHK